MEAGSIFLWCTDIKPNAPAASTSCVQLPSRSAANARTPGNFQWKANKVRPAAGQLLKNAAVAGLCAFDPNPGNANHVAVVRGRTPWPWPLACALPLGKAVIANTAVIGLQWLPCSTSAPRTVRGFG
eukprot:426977-Prymnesium_polylepis.1